MENIKKLFGDDVGYFYSSSGNEGTENICIKFLRLLACWALFPFFIFSKKVLHVNTSFDMKAVIRDSVLIFWGRVLRKKLVVQYHGGDPESLSLLKNNWVKIYLKWLYLEATVLVLTDSQLNWLNTELSISSLKMKNYVSLPETSSKEHSFVRFIYMGRIVRAKGVFEIINSSASLTGRDFRIDIYGSGEDAKELDAYITELGVGEIVSYNGTVTGIDKERAFEESNIFLYPSYYPEGLPYSVLEAMSFQNAIICTDAGALETLLEDGVTCLKVEMQSEQSLAKAMRELIDNPTKRDRLSLNARRLIEEDFSLPVLKSTLEKVWLNASS